MLISSKYETTWYLANLLFCYRSQADIQFKALTFNQNELEFNRICLKPPQTNLLI